MTPARSSILIFMAAAALIWASMTARAEVAPMPPNAEAAPAGSGLQVLSGLSNPRAARQVQQVTCDRQAPSVGPNGCVVSFGKVPAGHLLQIDKIDCFDFAPAYVYNTQVVRFQAPYFLGALRPIINNDISTALSVGTGPYYFKAGERLIIHGNGATPTTNRWCSIFGTLWTAR